MGGLDGLVGGPVAAPGIPRSRRSAGSRPFRRAKGAFVPEPLGFWRLGCVWVVGPLAAPGIPRSRRSAGSRPFRRAKGAFAPEPLGFWRLGCV